MWTVDACTSHASKRSSAVHDHKLRTRNMGLARVPPTAVSLCISPASPHAWDVAAKHLSCRLTFFFLNITCPRALFFSSTRTCCTNLGGQLYAYFKNCSSPHPVQSDQYRSPKTSRHFWDCQIAWKLQFTLTSPLETRGRPAFSSFRLPPTVQCQCISMSGRVGS